MYNTKYGVYAFGHAQDLSGQIPSKMGLGMLGGVFAYVNSQNVFFAALLLLNIANPLLMLTISAEEPIVVELDEDEKEAL